MIRGMMKIALGSAMTLAAATSSAQDWQLPIQAPPYARVQAEGGTLLGDPRKGEYLLSLPTTPPQKSKIRAEGPFGGVLTQEFSSENPKRSIHFDAGVIVDRNPNPSSIAVLPALCPRLRASEGEASPSGENSFRFVYQGAEDRLNQRPMFQMQDPDALQGKQAQTISKMDGRNVLLLKKVRITYDYEDSNIIDYEDYDPKTGIKQRLHEGMGGFYANFHYAIVPYSPDIPQLPRQTLLSLAQGRLRAIGREELRPALRVHAFLPGPFFSKNQWNYPLCEWGDTERHSPNQSLEYEGIAMWDWDYPMKDPDRVLLIVWEEDEEQEWIQNGRIPANFLMDDLVGVFEVRRQDTLQPTTFRSPRGDFEITLSTGNLSEALARHP